MQLVQGHDATKIAQLASDAIASFDCAFTDGNYVQGGRRKFGLDGLLPRNYYGVCCIPYCALFTSLRYHRIETTNLLPLPRISPANEPWQGKMQLAVLRSAHRLTYFASCTRHLSSSLENVYQVHS